MNALTEVIRREQHSWEIVPVDLQDVLKQFDPVQFLTGRNFAEMYTRLAGSKWTIGAVPGLKLLQAFIRLRQSEAIATFNDYWRRNPVDMVVSVIPHFNRVLALTVKATLPKAPFVTILTDMANYPPHFWIERESEYLICGSERAVQQAKQAGHDDQHVFHASGMVIHPRFYEALNGSRSEQRERLGLKADLPTGLVLFGGGGSSAMLEIAERLEHCREELQLIFICGHNDELVARLRARKSKHPFFIEGFTREVPFYMHLSDFFIGKPGPGSISEALQCGLPVILQLNLATLPQERYNAEWVREAQLGIVVSSFGDINSAVSTLLSNPIYRQNAMQVRNRAVFEIPVMLQKILESHASASADRSNAHGDYAPVV